MTTFQRRAKEWFNSFPVYDSDQEAKDDGLEFGDPYKTSDQHETCTGGILKIVMLP